MVRKSVKSIPKFSQSIIRAVICLTILAALPTSSVFGEDDTKWFSCPPFIDNGELRYTLSAGTWRFHSGDDPTWSEPEFDDSGWENVDSRLIQPGADATKIWNGYGWFRIDLQADSSFQSNETAMLFLMPGAAEIYIDGELVATVGKFSTLMEDEIASYIWTEKLVPLALEPGTTHIIAVRYSNHLTLTRQMTMMPAGFMSQIGTISEATSQRVDAVRQATGYQLFFTGLALAFSLLHLLLFLFQPTARQNIYFSALSLFMAALIYSVFEGYFVTTLHESRNTYWLFNIALIGVSVSGVRFVYSLFYTRRPQQYWFFLAVGVGLALLSRRITHELTYIYALLAFAEELRAVTAAIIRKYSGAWIVGLGLLAFALGSGHEMLHGLGLMMQDDRQLWLWGFLGLLISMSVYLAREFAAANKQLSLKIVEVEELSEKNLEQERSNRVQAMERLRLEEENKRKQIELEEARKLQAALDNLAEANNELEQTNRNLRDTQAHLVQSEKMASLGMLVAGVAHEINTPVGAISSMHNTLIRAVNKLRSKMDTDPKHAWAQELLDVMEDANNVITTGTQRVTDIVKRLRSFARLDEAELKTVDIHEGIEDTLVLFYHEMKHKTKIEKLYEELPKIACFPGKLNQVYLNLLVNATQAIPEKGIITISTRAEDGKVFIDFKDTGIGIPPDMIEDIFDPGFTTKGVGVGTGLGLSICYQIIQDHQGEIIVASEEGKGSKFTIILPDNLQELLINENG